MSFMDLLLSRRSVLANNMLEPGPSSEEIDQILAAGHRVPDHGKLGPWRFILFSGPARGQFGEALRARSQALNPNATEAQLEFEQQRFVRAPLIIAVVSSPVEHKVPEWEQVLSAGAACQNILLASSALGYAAQWLTEWYAFDEEIAQLMGLEQQEKIAGFIYIGSFDEKPNERPRPDLNQRISFWNQL